LYSFLEADGQLLALRCPSFAWPTLAESDGNMRLYAGLSLSAVRMVHPLVDGNSEAME